jgi:hypothetical protein
MAKYKQRQALALSARHAPLAAFQDKAVAALEAEAARIFNDDAEKRMNGGTSLHLVASDGYLSGFVKDAHTMVRFGGGAVAVTTHD